MTVEEIQRFLRTLHRDSLERSAALRDREPDSNFRAIFAELESHRLKQVKPSPGRTALTFAGLSFEEQEQIEDYAEMLIDEAHALCMRLQARCPTLRESDNGELWDLERVYRAQWHAMVRLRHRCDEGLWIRAHIRKARRWLEEAYVESVN
jgi:hypothetical protein